MSFWVDDLASLFSDFGVTASYRRASASSFKELKVIYPWKNPYKLNMGIEQSNMQAGIKSADVPYLAHGDVLKISGTTYYCIGIEDDETGVVVAHLSTDA